MGGNMTAEEWRTIDEALDKKLGLTENRIIDRVKAMIFGENGNNGINGKCEKNIKEIEEIKDKVDSIEKQQAVVSSVKKEPEEIEKIKIEWENKYRIEKNRTKWLFLTTVFGNGGFLITLITIILAAIGVIQL